jgi:uncharacterized protein with HEPN domain
VLIHAYGDVDPREVWDTIEHDLPQLRAAVDDLLKRAPRVE